MSTAPKKPHVQPLTACRALVVGGTSGIGLAGARALLAAGAAMVTVVGRDPARGQAAVASLGARARFLQADCADGDQAEAMAQQAAAQMGGIDVLVASSGTTHLPELLFRQPIAQLRESLLKDLLPPLNACRAVLPIMMAQNGGSIITIASDAGKTATPGEVVIGAGMAAIIQFTRGLAIEGKRNGIRANCLTPSLVEGTPLTERLMQSDQFAAKIFTKARSLAALGSTTPEDLANMIVFLASPASARLTGQAISINGGISAA